MTHFEECFWIARERQAATRGPDSGSYLVAEELQWLKREIGRLTQERDALQVELDAVRRELNARKGRRCETCRRFKQCDVMHYVEHCSGMAVPGFCCSRWEAKDDGR